MARRKQTARIIPKRSVQQVHPSIVPPSVPSKWQKAMSGTIRARQNVSQNDINASDDDGIDYPSSDSSRFVDLEDEQPVNRKRGGAASKQRSERKK